MNIIDLRKKLQQSSTIERRVSEHRKVSYQFGLPEWMEYMKHNNFECPAEDRRKIIRHSEDRKQATEQTNDAGTTYKRIFLTLGERKLLQDIYLSDLD